MQAGVRWTTTNEQRGLLQARLEAGERVELEGERVGLGGGERGGHGAAGDGGGADECDPTPEGRGREGGNVGQRGRWSVGTRGAGAPGRRRAGRGGAHMTDAERAEGASAWKRALWAAA